MVGVEGGLMAIIHLVLKRPILGLLGVTMVVVSEFNDYPVAYNITRDFAYVSCAIEDAQKEAGKFFQSKVILADNRRNIIYKKKRQLLTKNQIAIAAQTQMRQMQSEAQIPLGFR